MGVNKAETKFRVYIKKLHPEAYVKKIPDFKQTGLSGGSGLPDYLVIDNGITDWYEVKLVTSPMLFPFSALSESQWIGFRQMSSAGATIWIAAYMGGELRVFSFKRLFERYTFYQIYGQKPSVRITELVS